MNNQNNSTASFLLQQSMEDSKRKKQLIFASILINLILTVAIAILATKESKVQTYLLQTDSNGLMSLPTYIGDKEGLYQEESIAKSGVYNYVLNRENYNYFTINKQYEYVYNHSDNNIKNDYNLLFKSSNGGIIGELKNDYEISVSITSLDLARSPDSLNISDNPYFEADFTFKQIVRDLKANTSKVKNYRGKLVFYYDLAKELSAKDRLENPLAFTVNSYKVFEYAIK